MMAADNFANPAKVVAFLAKWRAVPDTDCLVWTGSCNQQGQPQVGWGTVRLAKRVAWQIANGALPTGAEVYSTCGVLLCGNAEHLAAGSGAERRMATREARKAAPAVRYAQRARISDADTAVIKGLVAGGARSPISRAVLADTYDCTPKTISRIWAEAREEERTKAVYLARDAERTARDAAEKPTLADCLWFQGERFDRPVSYAALNSLETALI
jgi:hypothetical protein